MDLSTFNKGLKKLVISAKRYEIDEKFKDAKEAWIQVAEYTINFYKHTELEPSFRNMLIGKTEGIIQHVKKLDTKIRMSKSLSTISQKQQNQSIKHGGITGDHPSPSNQETQSSSSQIEDEYELPEVPNSPPQNIKTPQNNTSHPIPPKKKPEIIDDSDFKNLPEGFKEIKAPKDFKIFTPHDAEEVRRRLTQDEDMSIFKYDGKENETEANSIEKSNVKLKQKDKKKEAVICMYCGEKNLPGARKCKNCGTELD